MSLLKKTSDHEKSKPPLSVSLRGAPLRVVPILAISWNIAAKQINRTGYQRWHSAGHIRSTSGLKSALPTRASKRRMAHAWCNGFQTYQHMRVQCRICMNSEHKTVYFLWPYSSSLAPAYSCTECLVVLWPYSSSLAPAYSCTECLLVLWPYSSSLAPAYSSSGSLAPYNSNNMYASGKTCGAFSFAATWWTGTKNRPCKEMPVENSGMCLCEWTNEIARGSERKGHADRAGTGRHRPCAACVRCMANVSGQNVHTEHGRSYWAWTFVLSMDVRTEHGRSYWAWTGAWDLAGSVTQKKAVYYAQSASINSFSKSKFLLQDEG